MNHPIVAKLLDKSVYKWYVLEAGPMHKVIYIPFARQLLVKYDEEDHEISLLKPGAHYPDSQGKKWTKKLLEKYVNETLDCYKYETEIASYSETEMDEVMHKLDAELKKY